MERRDFMKLSGLTMAGMAMGFDKLLQASDLTNANLPFSPVDISWEIYGNGTFDLVLPEIKLAGCIPSMDNKTIIPVKVDISRQGKGGLINYTLVDGSKIELVLGADEKGASLSSSIKTEGEAPHYFYPLANATIEGADRFFKQGMGFAGPSGVFDFKTPKAKIESAVLKEEAWAHDSYLVSGFLSQGNTLVMGAHDHTQYLQRSTFYNRQHRFGLIDRHLSDNENLFEAGFSTENIAIKGELKMPELYFSAGVDPFATFRDKAQRLADFNKVKLPHEPRYYYCSWYDKGRDFCMNDLEEILAGLKNIKPALPLQAIQIDAGYSFLGDWLVGNERFPDGMEKAFNAITAGGFSPGVWIGPFMVNSNSPIYKEHKDWLLRDKNGDIIMEWKQDNHSPGSVHVLDTSHPDAFAYLRKVFKQMRAWGVTTYKTDFLDWGLRDSTTVTRYTPGKTSTQYFNEVVEMIREEIGEESFWVGCISPFQPLIGKVNAVRTSNDVGETWRMENSGNMVKEMFADHYMNNVLWQNDPDVFYTRSYKMEMNQAQKEALAYYDGILGGVVNTSDAFHKLSAEELQLVRFTQPGKVKTQAVLPFWGTSNKDVFVVAREYTDLKAWGVLFVNISTEDKDVQHSLKEVVGIDSASAFEWGPAYNKSIGSLSSFDLQLKKESCQLFYISKDGKAPAKDLSLGGVNVKGLG